MRGGDGFCRHILIFMKELPPYLDSMVARSPNFAGGESLGA